MKRQIDRAKSATISLMKRLSSVVAPSEEEIQRNQMKKYGNSRKKSKIKKKRISSRRTDTVTSISYPMYVIQLDDIIQLFGNKEEGLKRAKIPSCRELKRMGKLVLKEKIPSKDTTIYVSHEWGSWKHADPKGVQIRTLCEVLKQYKSSRFKWNFSDSKATETRNILAQNCWIWFDWFCIPQDDLDEEEGFDECERIRGKKSIPAYIERSTLMLILAPYLLHSERIDPRTRRHASINYRTWRQCGYCLSEMMYAFLSRYKAHPIILVRSVKEPPIWITASETLHIPIGNAKFVCCEKNHEGDIDCDRNIAAKILNTLHKTKILHLYAENQYTRARIYSCFRGWWFRGLMSLQDQIREEEEMEEKMEEEKEIAFRAVNTLKRELRWRHNSDEFFDHDGYSVLIYAIIRNDRIIVRRVLQTLVTSSETKEKYLRSMIKSDAYRSFGLFKGSTALSVATSFSHLEIVRILLEFGCDPLCEATTANPLLSASTFGRVQIVKYWLKTFPDWNLESEDTTGEGATLARAVAFGPGRYELIQTLLKAGARVDAISKRNGMSILMLACANVDADSKMLKILIKSLDIKSRVKYVNMTSRSGSFAKRCIDWIRRRPGHSALYIAVRRGDVDLVETLLAAGADPDSSLSLEDVSPVLCSMF